MTKLSIELSAKLRQDLGHPGVDAYAVYFTPNAAQKVHWTHLVDNGTPAANPSIELSAPFIGGKVYFLIQSQDPAAPHKNLPTLITKESDINWNDPHTGASTLDYRYDSFEVTLTPGAADQGNLTSVNGFGIPMQLKVEYSDHTTATRGYDISGASLFAGIADIAKTLVADYSAGPLKGHHRMAASAAEAVSKHIAGFSNSDWLPYVTSLESNAKASAVHIAGLFNGAPDANKVWHNAGFYSYQLSWDAAGHAFWLTPTAESQIKGLIRITPENLANSIYATNGSADIYSDSHTVFLKDMNTGANNQWGTILRDVVTGFTAGYYGSVGKALNAAFPQQRADLDKSWNWDPTYAFGHNLVSKSDKVFYDQYAKLFFEKTNSYGSGYSDNLMKAFAEGPLISVANGNGSDVDNIAITLFSDTEKPTGYEAPVIDNFHAGPYVQPKQFVGDGVNITLNFNVGTMALKPDVPLTLGFYSGMAGGKAAFKTVAFPHGESLFQNWNLLPDGAGYKLVSFPGAQPPGSLLINQLPVSAGVNWYQITVGSGADAKTFNLYVQAEAGGKILNPAFHGQEGSIAIDGLASITPPNADKYLSTFPVNFFAGGIDSIDPKYLAQVTDQHQINSTPEAAPWPKPVAPLLGKLSGGVFKQDYVPSPSHATPPDKTVNHANIAFGWNGADASATHIDTLSAYTNKIGALNVAQVSFTSTNGHAPAPLTAKATIDGQWVTKDTHFGNGTYSAVMKEFAPTDHAFHSPLAKASFAQTFTVKLANLDLMAANAGNGLEFVGDGSGTTGNWVRLETSSSTLPNGALLAYATDADGNLVSRDGRTGPGITLDDAILARVGVVENDDGGTLFNGEQSVYLPVGQELRFAIDSGNNAIEELPGVQVTGTDALSVNVTGDFGALHLSATVENTLSDEAALAHSQRAHDEAWAYLTQGATVEVDVAGSAWNVNAVHFVRIDVDAATGAWSVGGVAYGNTEDFRAAVQDNWDPGFVAQGGRGDFSGSVDWTVSTGTGFYAPVLATEKGDVFVIGEANADGSNHIRSYGENVFGFEDLRADQGSDFDFNDLVVQLSIPDL